ncbi:MAG TPA: AraC family transcriptional regulator [Ruminiclostridium sp.]|nr:AraC family transcriptional regulator [Ruminiclostridium sp.]
MILEGLHEKGIFEDDFPFRLDINTQDNFEYPVHWHSAVELLYVQKNDFRITVNNIHYVLNEGDILFIANGDTHSFSNRNSTGSRVFIQFDSSVFGTLGGSSIIKPLISNSFLISRKDIPYYENLKNHILGFTESYTSRHFGYELFLRARIYDILSVISSFIAGKASFEDSYPSVRKIQGLEKLTEAFKYIEDNYMNDISLTDVAKAVGFSEFYFSRIFKDITEKSFSHYLNEYRIKKAEYLLADSCMPIAEIAYSVGFNSIVTFNRSFKGIKGCSPSVYKKIGL